MENLTEMSYAGGNSKRAITHKSGQMTFSHFYSKLSSWKEESQRMFSNILDSHSSIIDSHSISVDQTINELSGDISNLQEQLSIITNERDNLLETVANLNGKIVELSSKLPIMQPSKDTGEIHDQGTGGVGYPEIKVVHLKEKDLERTIFSADFSIDAQICDGDLAYSSAGEGYPLHEENHTIFNELAAEYVENVEHVDVDDEVTEDNIDGGDLKQGNQTSCDSLSCVSNIIKGNKIKCLKDEAYFEEIVERESKFKLPTNESLGSNQMNQNVSNVVNLNGSEEFNHSSENEAIQDKDIESEQHYLKSTVKQYVEKPNKIGNYDCGECGYITSRKSSLKKHIVSVHEKIKKHACRQCEYSASLAGNLKQHIEQVHKKIRSHRCVECGKAFSQKSNLKMHIKGVHLKIRDHICGDCGHAYKKKQHLMEHCQIAHNVASKKLNCHKCPYKTSYRSNLNTHIKKMHEKAVSDV